MIHKIKALNKGLYKLVLITFHPKLNSSDPSSQKTKGRPKGALGKLKLKKRELPGFEHATTITIRKLGRLKRKV